MTMTTTRTTRTTTAAHRARAQQQLAHLLAVEPKRLPQPRALLVFKHVRLPNPVVVQRGRRVGGGVGMRGSLGREERRARGDDDFGDVLLGAAVANLPGERAVLAAQRRLAVADLARGDADEGKRLQPRQQLGWVVSSRGREGEGDHVRSRASACSSVSSCLRRCAPVLESRRCLRGAAGSASIVSAAEGESSDACTCQSSKGGGQDRR